MHRPDRDRSWTAVVQGGVIYGIEKIRHPEATFMREIANSYGIVPYDKFEWNLRKGDLIESNRYGNVSNKYFWIPSHKLEKRKFDLTIYCYSRADDAVPESLQSGKHELEKSMVVSCDLSPFINRLSKKSAIGPLKVDFHLYGYTSLSKVYFNDTDVGRGGTELSAGL